MTKQGDKANKKISKRLLVLTPQKLEWFHNEVEFKLGKPLGTILMHAVYSVIPADRYLRTCDLSIGTTAFLKGNIEKDTKREFIFGASTEYLRDEWIATIEYLRARAIYQNYVSKYCKITFPVKSNSKLDNSQVEDPTREIH